MVLSVLVLSILRGLIRRIQLETLTSSSSRTRPNANAAAAAALADSEGVMMEEQIGGGVAVLHQQQQPPLLGIVATSAPAGAAAEQSRERGDRTGGGGGLERGGGFMTAARLVTPVATQQPSTVSRTASSKRKLEELEIGIAESSASANSQVRARRESRDEVMEGSIAESSGRELSGRERFEGGVGVCAVRLAQAQALDGEIEMREQHGSNDAIDADAMWEEESGWNSRHPVEVTKDLADESSRGGEDVLGGSGDVMISEAAGNRNVGISTQFVPSQSQSQSQSQVESVGLSAPIFSINAAGVATSGGLAPTPFFGALSGGDSSVTTDVSSAGRGGATDDESAAGKDAELLKEIEVDGVRSRERENSRDVTAFELEEMARRYGNNNNSNNAHSVVAVANVEAPGSSFPLNTGYVTSFAVGGGGGVFANGVNGLNGEASSSRPMLVDSQGSPSRLQFFVTTYIQSRTVVIHAAGTDSIESVHQQILRKTGLPVSEQRLLFGGRQLQHDQTLAYCNVVNDATLVLVARMRSTSLPHSWQLINDLVATIRRMCASDDSPGMKLEHWQDTVRASVQEFLKMASKSVPVSEHMQVFQFAGATSALVMLLLSRVESNRECAEESITHFLQANDEYLPAHIHCHCASVLLEFCKLLSKSAPDHNLYTACRNALARLLDTVGIAHGSPYFYEAKADSIVKDFSPFVDELSRKLAGNLQWIAKEYATENATISFTSYVKEAKDFTAFVIPLCKAMEVCKGIDLSGSMNSTRGNDGSGLRYSRNMLLPFRDVGVSHMMDQGTASVLRPAAAGSIRQPPRGLEIGTHGWLRVLFLQLLHEIDQCLKAVDAEAEKCSSLDPSTLVFEDKERPLGWAPFVVVLKGLHSIAKLYDGAMDDLMTVLGKCSKAINMVIKQSRWQDDDYWLLDYKVLLDFESKRKLVMAMLPEPQDDHDERQEIIVHRSQLLPESFEMLAYVEPENLQGGISVEFAQEEATGPGVLREWFSKICREIFNCQNALFLPCPKDRRRFYPSSASGVNPGHLTYFRFCGRVIALALMHRVHVDVVFAVTFFKQLAGLPTSWEDAQDADPMLYESCKKILEMDPATVDSLGLTFVTEVEELGRMKTLELCQGGRDMAVNSENRRHFVDLLVHRLLVASVADQIKSFAQGFSDLLVNASTQQFLRVLDSDELDMLLYGKDRNISLDDWRKHTEYHDYVATDDQIIWFWQAVETMTPEQRRRLLFFSTSVTYLPAEGFAGLSSKFHIHKAHTDLTWLPTAHTCFHQLVVPAYPTYEIMRTRLFSLTEEYIAEGFGFA